MFGANDGTRTHDNRYHKPGLYQLSYVRHYNRRQFPRKQAPARELARPAGLEPATTGLEGRCSIRLSYGRPAACHASPAAKPQAPRPSFARSFGVDIHSAADPPPQATEVVGVEGFEPPTPCSQSKCATRLRYTP